MGRDREGPDGYVASIDDVAASIERRLFLARVQPNTSSQELRDIFGEYGFVNEVRLVGQKMVAFVGYDSWAAAHKALLGTDKKAVLSTGDGSALSVSFAERRGKGGGLYSKGGTKRQILVEGLDRRYDSEDGVAKLCDPFGKVEKVEPFRGRDGWLLTFRLWGEAMDAVEALNGKKMDDGYAKVEFFSSDRSLSRSVQRRRDSEPTSTRWRDFERLRAEYIALVDGDGSRDACDALHRQLMAAKPRIARSRSRSVSRSRSRSPRARKPRSLSPRPLALTDDGPAAALHRVYVTGLPVDCSDSTLKALVGQIVSDTRDIVSCAVTSGDGTLVFRSRQVAQAAIEELDEREVTGWPRILHASDTAPQGRQQRVEDRTSKRPSSPHKDRWSPSPNGRSPSRNRRRRSRSASRSPGPTEGGLEQRRLFVGQLQKDQDLDHGIFKDVFARFGPLQECRIIDGKGVGFITYRRARDAKAAMAELNGTDVRGISRNEGLSVKVAHIR